MASPDELITDARNYAVSVTASATSALVGAMNTVNQIGQGSIGGEAPKLELTLPTPGDPGAVPQYNGTLFEFAEFEGKQPNLDNIGNANFPPDPGPSPAVAPYQDPGKPYGAADPSLLLGVPNINTNITAPPAPIIDVNSIQKPTISDPVIPAMPTYTPPEFTGVKPAFNDAAPTGLDVMMKTEYNTIGPIMRDNVTSQISVFIDNQFPQFRTGLAAIETRLATYLQGGTALTPEIENAIYSRTIDKTDRDARRAKDEAWGRTGRAGWTMPLVSLNMQQNNVDQERRNNNARAATDIAIKQAELEQSNLQFAVTQSTNLRQIMLTSAMAYFQGLVQINGQALEYARGVVEYVVKAYELAMQYASLQVRIYEAEATVYRARLEAEMAKIQVYEAQIRGVLAQVEVDNAKVTLYRTQLEACTVQAQVYKIQVEALQAQISIEQMKVELYSAKVGAYTAQVNGYTAQWHGYSAAVSGEVAKVQASAESIRAYSARVNAYQAVVGARATEIESKARVNAQKLEAYKTEVEAYRSLIDATATAIGTEINSYDATIKAFMAKANAISEKSRSEIAVYEVAQRGVIEGARLTYDYVREQDNLNVARATGASRIAEAIGGIYAGVAEATLAGMNSLAASTQTTSA